MYFICFIFLSQAIFELFRGEQDLIEDLKLARKVSENESIKSFTYKSTNNRRKAPPYINT